MTKRAADTPTTARIGRILAARELARRGVLPWSTFRRYVAEQILADRKARA